VITKLDLLPHAPFSVERAEHDALLVQSAMQFFQIAALRAEGAEGIVEWGNFLIARREEILAAPNRREQATGEGSP